MYGRYEVVSIRLGCVRKKLRHKEGGGVRFGSRIKIVLITNVGDLQGTKKYIRPIYRKELMYIIL